MTDVKGGARMLLVFQQKRRREGLITVGGGVYAGHSSGDGRHGVWRLVGRLGAENVRTDTGWLVGWEGVLVGDLHGRSCGASARGRNAAQSTTTVFTPNLSAEALSAARRADMDGEVGVDWSGKR